MTRPVSPAITRSGNAEFVLTGQIGGVALALGAIPYASGISKFGYNSAVGTIKETIWDAGGLYPWPTTIETVSVVSSSASDTSAGIGARSIMVSGLDADYIQQDELVILNGVTPVITTKTWSRVFRAYTVVAGSNNSTVGIISITQTTSGNLLAQIIDVNNQTLQAVYTVPAGKSGYLESGVASVGKGKDVQIYYLIRTPGGVFRVGHTALLYENSYVYKFAAVGLLPEKTDIEVRGQSTGTVSVSAAFELILIDN